MKNLVFRRHRRFGRRTVAFWGRGSRKRKAKSYSKRTRSKIGLNLATPSTAPDKNLIYSDSSLTKKQENISQNQSVKKPSWKERYAEIRSSRANAKCKEKAILSGVCSGLVAQAIYNKLTITVEVREHPAKYLFLVRLKFLIASLFFGIGILAYLILVLTERSFTSWDDFSDSKILTNEEKDEARRQGWDIS